MDVMEKAKEKTIRHVVTEQEYCPFCGAKMDGGAD